MLTSIDIHTGTYDDETGDTKYSFRTLELGPPRIEFEGQAVMEPAVHLVLPVEGIYYQRSDQKKSKLGEKRKQLDISNPYDVRLSGIKLGSVKGKYETVMKPKSQGKVASVDTLPVPIESSKKTVVFREDGTKPTQDSYEVAWVVLDFPMDGAALNVDMVSNVKPGEPLHDQAFTMKNNVLGAVKSYFKDGPARIDVLEYALATIKNTPQFNGAITVDLTPVSFRFATYASSYQTSILSLFIHTLSGTDAGEKNDLQVKWMASWTNNKISPIPAGYTASLLISPGLALNTMLKAGLEKGGDFKVDAIKDNKEGGLSFSARYQRSWSVPHNEYAYQAGVYECIMEIWPWNKDLKVSNWSSCAWHKEDAHVKVQGNPVSFKIYQKVRLYPVLFHSRNSAD